MLFALKNIGLGLITALTTTFIAVLAVGDGCAATDSSKNPSAKPDLQKVYNEAMTWSKTKLETMPDTNDSHATAGIGVCVGANADKPLAIKPPCPKKQDLDAVLDDVTDGKQSAATRRNVHADKMTGSTNPPLPKLLVFVSFSMPKASLLTLAKSAAQYNAVLVMQGLKDDSFKATQQAFMELIGEEGQGGQLSGNQVEAQGFEVNPELFKTYKIKHVPVFILVKGDQELGRLSGNVSLNFAAKKLQGAL